MDTGKPALSSIPVHTSSFGAQAKKRMDTQAPLTAVYIQTVPNMPMQPYPQPPPDPRETNALHLARPPLYSTETLPFLTLHLAGGLQPQLGLSSAAATAPAPAVKPKSAGKHVCPHCGRDCMKPSVLEKHLCCHTGERPYPCTTCGVSFKTQSNLYKHRRTQAHARQSSESEQSNVGSLDSISSSRETCSSSVSLDEQCEELGSEVKDTTLTAAESTAPVVQMQSAVSEERHSSPKVPNAETNAGGKLTVQGDKQKLENKNQSLNISRHLQLQRQEATLFSKQWDNSISRAKSQSHESTDSGFSESSDHNPGSSSVFPENSLDSFSKSSREHLEETQNELLCSESSHGGMDEKDTAREQVQRRLEERISKLISENSAVVEDKQLENVRPRKTVLSKQGSIDLPMPYTYKDSFHFDMRNNPTQNIMMQRHTKPGLYNSVPTQCSSTMEHAPLTHSSSLPFSVTLLQPEKSSPTSSIQNDYATDSRRGRSGQINPTGLLKKPVNQHSSVHRPLVRQTAVDCNHTTDSLLTTSSVEEACTGSLSCDGDGSDLIGEPSRRKFQRKKSQKFAYNKWYMYGGGTFKKLYGPDKSGETSAFKGRKCSTNVVQEAVQSIQKRVSVVHKETVSRSGSTVNISTSNATAGHLSASLSPVSSADLNVQRCHHQLTHSCANVPPRRHLSLSLLPLPATRSVSVPKTKSLNQTEAERLVNVPKVSDSMIELNVAHIPSDRKKQKTGEKVISTLETESEPNTPTRHPASESGSAPPQGTELTMVQAKQIPNSPDLKGAIFLQCLLNTNVSQISTSAPTSVPFATRSSFLPKYQLKLPNAHEPDPVSLQQVVIEPKEGDDCSPTPPLSTPTPTNQTSVTASENIFRNSITLSSIQTQNHVALTYTATSMCQSKTSQPSSSLSSSVSVMQRQFAATTITTSCFQDYTRGLCSAMLHCSKTATDSKHKELPRPLTTAAPNLSSPLINTQTYAATITGPSHHLSYHSSNPSLGRRQISTESAPANPGNKANVDSHAPVVHSCIMPLDEQAQNVFHVHTADLQIRLQIISDEQMALIAPQIEHQSGPSLSQTREIEIMTSEGAQNKTQNVVSMKISNLEGEYGTPRNKKEVDKQESLSRLNLEEVTPQQSGQSVKEKTDHEDIHKTESITKFMPHPAPSQTLQNNGHLIMVTQTQNSAGSIMATCASFRDVESGGSHTSEAEQVLFPNLCTEETFLPNNKIRQGRMVPQIFSDQHKICGRSLSTCVVNQSSMTSEPLDKRQQKSEHLEASSNADVLKIHGGGLACKISRTASAESLKQGNSGKGINGSVSQFSIDNSNIPRQLNPQAFVFHSHQVKPTKKSSLKYANKQLNRGEPSGNSSPSLEFCSPEIHNVIRREHSEKSLDQLDLQSASVDMRRHRDITNFQSSTTGITKGAHKDLDSHENRKTPVQPESTDRRPKQNQGEPEKKHQRLEEQGGDGLTGEDQNRAIYMHKAPESYCRHVAEPDMTTIKGEERNPHVDPSEIPCLSAPYLESPFQKNSETSPCPPPNHHPGSTPHTSHNSDRPTQSFHTSLLDYPPVNHPCPPQKNCDRSIIICDQEIQAPYESSCSQHTLRAISSSETRSDHLCAEPSLQSLSRQDETKTPVSLSAQQVYTTTGNYSCDVFTIESKNNHSVLPDFSTLSSAYLSRAPKACGSTGEMTGDKHMTVSPSQPFSFLEAEKKQDNIDTPNDFTNQSCNSERQSIFTIGSFNGYQPADCLPCGVRPVPSFQDNTEDTSSSDDEGKLIIEL